MNDFDARLRSLLDLEAAGVEPDRSRLQRVLTGVRRQRAGRAAGAALVACAVVAGAVAGVSTAISTRDDGGSRAASGASGAPAFESQPGSYPIIASGDYGGRHWRLSVVEDPDAAHPEDTESENPEILLESEGPAANGAAFETHTGWSVLAEPFHTTLHKDREVVMGMVADSAASVAVETDGGDTIVAAVFDGGDTPVEATNYYLAFLPLETSGEVVVRDANGDRMGTMPLPRLEPPPDVELSCAGPSDAEADEQPEYDLIGEGGFLQRWWSLEMIADPDRAHPEDTESDNPEILFRIDGPKPSAAAYETHGAWDVIDLSYHGPIDGAEVVMGMASADVASVRFDSDDGESGDAALFEGRDVPRPGTKHFIVFLRKGATGELVARDASGNVVGRVQVDRLEEHPSCETMRYED